MILALPTLVRSRNEQRKRRARTGKTLCLSVLVIFPGSHSEIVSMESPCVHLPQDAPGHFVVMFAIGSGPLHLLKGGPVALAHLGRIRTMIVGSHRVLRCGGPSRVRPCREWKRANVIKWEQGFISPLKERHQGDTSDDRTQKRSSRQMQIKELGLLKCIIDWSRLT